MTDISLLREFRARLAERDAIMPTLTSRVGSDAAVARKSGDWFKISNLSAESADIHIFDEIGMYGTTAQGFVDQLNSITAPKITVYLNSPGGEVFDGIAIHTALAMSKAHVTTFVTGVAASAASFIAMAGDTIKMARNATMMIHDASGLAWGNAETMRSEADLLDKLSDNIADMYAMQAGGTAEDWRAAMKRETWYTGREALDAGLIDEITEPDVPQEEVLPANRLSLALFNYAGRAEAPAPEPIPDEDIPLVVDLIPDPAEEARQINQDKADLLLAFLAERTKSL